MAGVQPCHLLSILLHPSRNYPPVYFLFELLKLFIIYDLEFEGLHVLAAIIILQDKIEKIADLDMVREMLTSNRILVG